MVPVGIVLMYALRPYVQKRFRKVPLLFCMTTGRIERPIESEGLGPVVKRISTASTTLH
jgi:hypothetical protein